MHGSLFGSLLGAPHTSIAHIVHHGHSNATLALVREGISWVSCEVLPIHRFRAGLSISFVLFEQTVDDAHCNSTGEHNSWKECGNH